MELSSTRWTRTIISALSLTLVACGGPSSSDEPSNSKGDIPAPPALIVNERNLPFIIGCFAGSLQVDSGLDTNLNRTIDTSEITQSYTLCNRENTASGDTSITFALLRTAEEGPGAHCSTGGIKMLLGLDENNNDILEDNEVLNIEYACQATTSSSDDNNTTRYRAHTVPSTPDTKAYPQCLHEFSQAFTTEYFEWGEQTNTNAYAVCREHACFESIPEGGGFRSLAFGDGTPGCETYSRTTVTCFPRFELSDNKDSCVEIDFCAQGDLDACPTQNQCEQASGHWWDERCQSSPQPMESISIVYPTETTNITPQSGQHFTFRLTSPNASLNKVRLNDITVTHLFSLQNDGRYQASFDSIEGYLNDDNINTLVISATNSLPASINFSANVTSPAVVITEVSTVSALPQSGAVASVAGRAHKKGLQSVSANATSMLVLNDRFWGQLEVPLDVASATSEPDYVFTANYDDGIRATTAMVAYGRPIANALSLQINDEAYGPINTWLADVINARLREDSVLFAPATAVQLCTSLLKTNIATCDLQFEAIADTAKPRVEVQSVNSASDQYDLDLRLKLTFDFLSVKLVATHDGQTTHATLTWDSENPATQPLSISLNLRARPEAAADGQNGLLLGLYLQDLPDNESIQADIGVPQIADTRCAIGCSTSGESKAPVSDITISSGWAQTRVSLNVSLINQLRATLSQAINTDWNTTDAVLVSALSIPATSSTPRPIVENHALEYATTTAPGEARTTENGLFLSVASGSQFTNATAHLSALNPILGSRFNTPSPMPFMQATDAKVSVALSENTVNQHLAMQYAAQLFDDINTISEPGDSQLTNRINRAIQAALPFSVGKVVQRSQIKIAVTNAPHVVFEENNTMRLVIQNAELDLDIDPGDGVINLAKAALNLEARFDVAIDAQGRLNLKRDPSSTVFSIMNPRANTNIQVNGIHLTGELARETETQSRRILLDIFPSIAEDYFHQVNQLVLPSIPQALWNLGSETPSYIAHTLPRVFGLRLSSNGVSVNNGNMILKGDLHDITTAPVNSLISLCVYASEQNQTACPLD
ncbi:Uncharacterised protein [BD1-7 clade bacterium]|uniref:DUF7151 domain-containing protein n=1 Tax=BD1-7 clade bacterium TaxID=2029982 RepID=A0A5S9MYL1_9GAMM|nr:Uncharacterised protein [BD1-7 clade bacterium]